MSEYVITTDNNSDLPEEYLKDHGVGCMYLSYSMDGKNYTHGNFLPEHEFYEAMRNGSMPTTAQVNPEKDVYKRQVLSFWAVEQPEEPI